MTGTVHQRRAATLQRIRYSIRMLRRYHWYDEEPAEGQRIQLFNFFDFVFDVTTDEQLENWFISYHTLNPELAMLQANRKTDKRNWPPARSTLERAARLYCLSVILGRDVTSTNDLVAGELRGIVLVVYPNDVRGQLLSSVSTEAYLLCRALLKGNGLLMAHLQTVPAL